MNDKLHLDEPGASVKGELDGRPLCGCHGEPMYKRRRSGYECSVAVKARAARAYAADPERKRAHQRDRYDTDPIYRIEKNLHDHARRRAETLRRRKENCGQVSE
jgi:hypothetical protein